MPSHPPGFPAGYPRDLIEVAYLRDGTEVELRPVLPTDTDALLDLFERCSPRTLYRRFFKVITEPRRKALEHLVNVDYRERLGLLALVGGEVVGVAHYEPMEPGRAEPALLVADDWQGRGIGTRLLWRLSAAARQRGLHEFVAVVLGENRPMMGLLRVIADDLDVQLEDGQYVVRVTLSKVRPQ